MEHDHDFTEARLVGIQDVEDGGLRIWGVDGRYCFLEILEESRRGVGRRIGKRIDSHSEPL